MKNHIMSHIREEEAKINLIRQERAKEYARVSLVDKTESKEKRLKSYAHERSLIKQEKNQMMIEFMREKDKIRQEFEQDKRKNPKSLSFDLEAKNLVPIKSITDRKISPKTNTSVKKVEIIDTPKKGEAHKKTASTAATSETSKEPKIPSRITHNPN